MGKKLSATQAAKRKGWHRNTIYRAVDSGRLPVEYTPGGHLRIDEDELEKLAKAKKQRST